MGIYLSEINMPKGEYSKLVLQIFPNGEVYDEHGIRLGITNWAEAVPVPTPHGRLIDADALIKELTLDDEDDNSGASLLMAIFLEVLKAAPTILEAEEGE